MKYLIIPSASFAPKNLGHLYNVPMALYPINDDPIINLILQQYQKEWCPVVAGYNGFEMLLQNPNIRKNCRLIKIDEMKDIGFTILNTMEKLAITNKDKIIINFADTVVDNNDLTTNCIIYKPAFSIDKKWTYLIHKNGYIKEIVDKTIHSDNVGETMCLVCGVFSIDNPLVFLECLRSELNQIGCDFYKALRRYSATNPFVFLEAQNWLDIGHPDEYFDSKIAIKSRQFNHIAFDKNRGILTKTSENDDKLVSEIDWFIKLPKDLQYVIPRIFDYSLTSKNAFVKMEFYQYPTLLELSLFSDIDLIAWKRVFERIRFVLEDFSKYKMTDSRMLEATKEMYEEKTISRLNKMRDFDSFKLFFEQPIVINGIKYKSLDKISSIVPHIVESNLLKIDSFCIIHGDLCFANILIDEKLNFVKLIDPRGSFGCFDIYGDQRYELAKLFHSIDGKYDYIIKDLFTINVNGNSIDYSFENVKFDLYSIAKESLCDIIGTNIKEIEIIEGLLFLSMLPLHPESSNHQLIMLARGIEILDRWIDLKEEK